MHPVASAIGLTGTMWISFENIATPWRRSTTVAVSTSSGTSP
jgi:hypothetical protein